MTQQYFAENPEAAHRPERFSATALGVTLPFVSDSGVFSRDGLDAGTAVLLAALGPLSGRLLDLGCGWGPVGVFEAAVNPALEVVMTDVNRRAAELAAKNAAENGLRNVRVVCADGFGAVEGAFDTIAMNPPIRAGKAVIYPLLERAADFLAPGGRLVIVIRKRQGAESALKFLRERYANVECLDKSGGYWVLACSR